MNQDIQDLTRRRLKLQEAVAVYGLNPIPGTLEWRKACEARTALAAFDFTFPEVALIMRTVTR